VGNTAISVPNSVDRNNNRVGVHSKHQLADVERWNTLVPIDRVIEGRGYVGGLASTLRCRVGVRVRASKYIVVEDVVEGLDHHATATTIAGVAAIDQLLQGVVDRLSAPPDGV